MRVHAIRPYAGPTGADGLVAVYDLTVARHHVYRIAAGVLVANSKRISMLDVNALLAHNAPANLRDAGAIRGQKNEEHWLQFMEGHTPRDPQVPFVYRKFIAHLKAAGINPVREGHRTHLMALTDADVAHLAGDREIRKGETVRFDRQMEPVPGGLFDPRLTGGHGGNSLWSKLTLHEPLPSPVMEEPIRRVLGLTAKKYEAVISGDHDLPGFGTGPGAIRAALASIHLPGALAQARVQAKASSKAHRDAAIRKLGYLKAAEAAGIHPRDWTLSAAPVLPPAFRPVSVLGDSGVPLVADPNVLYKELHEANDNLKAMHAELGDAHVGRERLALYHALKAVVGLGDPVTTKSKERNVRGVLAHVFGPTAKHGIFQRKLLSSTVDNVGRSVVVPDPDLDMDSVGMPESKAFDVYQKFVVRRLHRRGLPIREALRHVKDRTPLARDMLQEEMEARPVLVNRAPVLHKFGIMAFRPRLVAGDVLKMPPLVVKGLGMDFDGDTSQFHVPSTDEAVAEAYDRMLPSKNLVSPQDLKSPMHVPSQEYVGGLYHATTADSGRRPRVFRTLADARAAYARGDIAIDDPVQVVIS